VSWDSYAGDIYGPYSGDSLARLHVRSISSELIKISMTNVRQLKLPDDLLGCSIECEGGQLELQTNILSQNHLNEAWKVGIPLINSNRNPI
jgi:hypothetical protein